MKKSNKRNNHNAIKDSLLDETVPFAYSEAYKTLRTNLSFASLNGKYKKIIVTSPTINEGKSTVSTNLAMTLSETGARVLLLDCDLRNPSIHHFLRMRTASGNGLSNLLAGTANLKECIGSHPKMGFDFAPAGSVPPNPAELLGSSNMENLLKTLESQYDYIICDTAPTTLVTDAAVLSRYCDGVLLVVRQKSTTRDQVRLAEKNLVTAGAKIIGTVLNGYDIREDHNSAGDHYYYNYRYEYGK